MERILDALDSRARVGILECLIAADEPMSARGLRSALDVPSSDRAHFGRHLAKLVDVGLLEHSDGDGYVLVERRHVDRFLQSALDLEAAIDERRARRSGDRAKQRLKAGVVRETKKIQPAQDAR